MKGMALVSRGIEEYASREIGELTGSECRTEDGCVIFEFSDIEDLCLLCYKSQSANRILHLLCEFEFGDLFEEIGDFIKKINFETLTKDYRRIGIECMRIGNHKFNSMDVESRIGRLLMEKCGEEKSIALQDYEILVFAYIIDNKFYLGIDYSGFEMNKRDYKVHTHSNSLRGTIAYALIREAGLQKDHVVLDPFSRDGVIPIESALYCADFPVNYYKKEKLAFPRLKNVMDAEKLFKSMDKKIKNRKTRIFCLDHLFKYVDYSRKNAKIAGVDKLINFSRVELEWLDIKFKKESVDRIITNPPTSKNAGLDKVYNEFFYQSQYILKKGGFIALISKTTEMAKKHAGMHDFSVVREKEIWSGQQLLHIMVLKNR